MNHIKLSAVFALAAIYALMPFATDTYIPALPEIATDLSTEVEYVAMTVSLYIFAAAVGQLLGGLLSDQLGRIRVIVAGLLLFSLSSLFLSQVDNIAQLWIGRILQAFGAGIAIVGVPAIIRDNAEGREASQLFTLIGFVSVFAPAIAPVIGTGILLNFGWHSVFYFLVFYGGFASILCLQFLPRRAVIKEKKQSLIQGYITVFSNKKALGFLIANGLFFGSFFTYLANVSVAYIDYFGTSEKQFTALFVLNVGFMLIINRTSAFMLKSKEPEQILRFFQRIQIGGVSLLLLFTLFFPQVLTLTVLGLIAATCFNSAIVPNLNVLFMAHFKESAGVASGIFGASQAMLAAIISAIATYAYNGTLLPMVSVMFISSIAAFFLVRWQLAYNAKATV